MKVLSRIIPVLLVALLAVGWISAFSSIAQQRMSVAGVAEAAEQSVQDGLYDQAIEQYTKLYAEEPSEGVCARVAEIYGMYYAEEPTDDIRTSYVAYMDAAASEYPNRIDFWEKACELYLEAEEYTKAYQLLVRAANAGASSEKLDEESRRLAYTTTLGSRLYYDIKNCLNGCMTVNLGDEYQVLDDTGKSLMDGYKLIGFINDEGAGIYVNDIDTRLIDSSGIARGRYNVKIEDAGYVDVDTGLVPVKVDGAWRYLNIADGSLLDGSYEYAGCFVDGRAAVQADDGWYLIDSAGKKTSDVFEEIRVDLRGGWVHAGVSLIKQGGTFALYSEDLSRIGTFTCDDIDVYAQEDSPIAFKQGDAWGYVDSAGAVVHDPEYAEAKSFANGFAAIRGENGLWGYIDSAYLIAIDCQYVDALYFNSERVSLVSKGDKAYQTLGFVYG